MPQFILETAPALTHERAAEIAASWGSYQRDGDPGAIFYTFPGNRAPDWTEADRAAALAYCDSRLSIARGRLTAEAHAAGADFDPTADAQDAAEDVADLEALRRYIVGVGRTAFDDLDEFAQGFIEAAFFCNVDDFESRRDWSTPFNQERLAAGEFGGAIPHDASTADIDPASLEAVKALCDEFQRKAGTLLAAAYMRPDYDAAQAGRDLYFTRAGHGVGYWDRPQLGDTLGTALSEAAGRAEISLSFDAESGVTFHDV